VNPQGRIEVMRFDGGTIPRGMSIAQEDAEMPASAYCCEVGASLTSAHQFKRFDTSMKKGPASWVSS
jgi:hypothetical protein